MSNDDNSGDNEDQDQDQDQGGQLPRRCPRHSARTVRTERHRVVYDQAIIINRIRGAQIATATSNYDSSSTKHNSSSCDMTIASIPDTITVITTLTMIMIVVVITVKIIIT